ncbi:MAG: MFS transporter [Gammaproteobacteria bacterium]|nr:MFS transporter [Gammaproteobacteria bacterium]
MNNRKWLIFIAVSFVTTMINMDATIVNLALASIAKDFHASLGQIQWVVNIYMLTNIIFIILVGRLSDVFGRRSIYIIGIIVFTIASVLAGISHSLWLLIFARALQGVGFAGTLTLGLVIVANAFPAEQQGLAMGSYMTVAGIAQSMGPFLGGGIIQAFGWRWIFLINIPLGVLAIISVLMFCRRDFPNRIDTKINWYGFALLCCGLSLMLLALNEIGNFGLFSWKIWSFFALGLFFIFVLYCQDKGRDKFLIKFSLFSNRRYSLLLVIRFLYMYGWLSILFILPLYLQNIIGYNAFITGSLLLCMTLVFAFLSPVVGKWIDKIGYIKPVKMAILLSMLSFVLLAQLGVHLVIPCLVIALVLFGVSAPFMGSASAIGSMSNLPSEHAGLGMGIFYMLAFLGASTGVALSGSCMSLISASHFAEIAMRHGLSFSHSQIVQIDRMVNGSHSIDAIGTGFSVVQMKFLSSFIKGSFVHALSIVMYINAALAFVAYLLSLRLDVEK